MKLRSEVVDRIVVRLIGIYGQQFYGKYSRIESGVDVGIAMFKDALATELANFYENLEAIKYALDNLPSTHCPNALELRDIARHAPKKQALSISYQPTPEDVERNRRMAEKAAAALKPKFDGGIDKHWATHPRSRAHLAFIFDAASRDARFKPCISEMVEQGICSDDGHLFKVYRDGAFAKI